tara:strand:- start:52 stop:342 length:291 start_codon:yes stop_codon:yes gene_type:complete
MTNEEIYDACCKLSADQRRALGIYKIAELVIVLDQSGRKKLSSRTLQRLCENDPNFPVIRQPQKSMKPRNFFRLADVEAYLDHSFNTLKDHFKGEQ